MDVWYIPIASSFHYQRRQYKYSKRKSQTRDVKNANRLQLQSSNNNNRVHCVKNGYRFELKTSNNQVDKTDYSTPF